MLFPSSFVDDGHIERTGIGADFLTRFDIQTSTNGQIIDAGYAEQSPNIGAEIAIAIANRHLIERHFIELGVAASGAFKGDRCRD